MVRVGGVRCAKCNGRKERMSCGAVGKWGRQGACAELGLGKRMRAGRGASTADVTDGSRDELATARYVQAKPKELISRRSAIIS